MKGWVATNILARRDKDGKQIKVNGRLSWRLRWDTKDPGTGKRRGEYETFRGTKREAERRWIDRDAEIRGLGAQYTKAAKVTVGEYMERWLRDYADLQCKPTTAASYREIAKNHIVPGLGAVPLADLTPEQVAAWLAEVGRKTTRAGQLLSPRRVAMTRATLRMALKYATKHRMIPSNPADLVDAPRQEPKTVEAFTLAEAHALDDAAEGRRLCSLYRVAWRTGLRMGELLALRWGDIDFDASTVTVERNMVYVNGRWHVQSPKTERGLRSLPLTKTVAAELRAHRARQAEERLRAGEAREDNALVFCTGTGRPLLKGNVERDYRAVRKAAGIRELGFHSLRHTYATLAKGGGIAIEDISRALGHESPAFTAKVYAHVTAEGLREASARFEEFTAKKGS